MSERYCPVSSKSVTDYIYDSRRLLDDPHGVFDEIRASGDVVWCPSMRRWLVLSKPAALSALQNPDLVVYDLFHAFERIQHGASVSLADLTRVCDWIPFLHDGPKHQRLRAFFARLLADIREDYLTAFSKVSQALLRGMAEAGRCDFATDYADRLHIAAIGDVAGFSAQDSAWLAENSSSQGSIDFAASVSEMQASDGRATKLLARVATLARHGSFPDRVGVNLTAAGLEDTPTSRIEAMTALLLLGRDTLAGTLTLGLADLLDRNSGCLTPQNWPNIDRMEEEFTRLSSPVQIVNRRATRPVQLAGQTVETGDLLVIFLPAANRDPGSFSCPHGYDADNENHMAFGASRHLCVGMPLSRAAIKIAVHGLAAIAQINALPGRLLDDSKNTRKFKSLPISIGVGQ
jgi:cytochrome P450